MSYDPTYDNPPIVPKLILCRGGGPDESKITVDEPSECRHIRTREFLSSGNDVPPQDLTLIYIRHQI